MISKCANPACSARFLFLHTGKLFRFERRPTADKEPFLGFDPTLRKHSTGVEFFWLCENCSATMRLDYRSGSGVIVRQERQLLKAAS